MRGTDLPKYRLNCTKFGKLILRKIVKTVASRCHILKLKCTKFDFGWGTHSAPPNPLDGYKGSTSKGREARARKGRGPTSMAIGRGGRKERRGKGVKG